MNTADPVADLAAAEAAAAEARQRRIEAEDAAEDAQGLVAVAETKVEDYESDENTARWQRVKAAHELAKAQRAAARTKSTLRDCEAAVDAATQAVVDAHANLDHTQQAEDSDAGPDALHFPTVYDFVEAFLVTVYARAYHPQKEPRWCDRWWEHPEAVSRLDALWRAFEHLRLDPGTGAAVWWRDYADPTMNILTSTHGPFSQCAAGQRHQVHPGLPVTPAPPALRSADE